MCGMFITPAKQIQKLLHRIEMLPYQRKKGKEKENTTICGIGFGAGQRVVRKVLLEAEKNGALCVAVMQHLKNCHL